MTKTLALAATLTSLAVTLGGCNRKHAAPPAAVPDGGAAGSGASESAVSGRAQVRFVAGGPLYPLEGGEAYLERDAVEVAQSAAKIAGGRYVLTKVAAGDYQICWRGHGLVQGCQTQKTHVGDGVAFGPGVIAMADPASINAIVRGKVTWTGGAPCNLESVRFGLHQVAMVSAVLDGGSRTTPVAAGSAGDYAILAESAITAVEAQCGDVTARADAHAGAAVDLELSGKPPAILDVGVFAAAARVYEGAPGAMLEARATASTPGVTFRWAADAADGTVGASGASTSWTLPDTEGLHSVAVLATDPSGAAVEGSLTVLVTRSPRFFAGQVVDDAGQPLAGASIRVDGSETMSDATGAFQLSAARPTGGRHVVRAELAGYMPTSRTLDQATGGLRLRLPRAPAMHLAAAPTLSAVIAAGAPGVGFRLDVDTRSLRGPTGGVPVGPVDLTFTALDLRTDPLPGDPVALDATGAPTGVRASNVFFIDARSPDGQTAYTLAAGASVRLSAPAGVAGGSYLPAHLDAAQARWILDSNTASQTYQISVLGSLIGLVSRSASSACIEVDLDWLTLPAGLTVQARSTVDDSVLSQQILESTHPAFLQGLKAQEQVKLVLLDRDQQPMAGVKIRNNLDQQPVAGNLVTAGSGSPNPSDADCGTAVYAVSYPLPDTFGWLSAVGQPASNNADAETASYYTAINAPPTLGAWWTANGFPAMDQVRATFMDDNDLGFGNDLTCRQTGPGTLACYTRLYGKPDQDPAWADFAESGQVAWAGVTLAMERSTLPGFAKPFVKFYAFTGGDAASPRTSSVDLDGTGPKRLPWVCANCHGMTSIPSDVSFSTDMSKWDYSNVQGPDLITSFRELDPSLLVFPKTKPRAAQEAAVAQINQWIKASLVAGAGMTPSPLAALIDKWYAANPMQQDATQIPDGWASNPGLYTTAVNQYCRTCHFVLPGITWETPDALKMGAYAYDYVFGSHAMPAARVPYGSFWRNGAAPAALMSFLPQSP